MRSFNLTKCSSHLLTSFSLAVNWDVLVFSWSSRLLSLPPWWSLVLAGLGAWLCTVTASPENYFRIRPIRIISFNVGIFHYCAGGHYCRCCRNYNLDFMGPKKPICPESQLAMVLTEMVFNLMSFGVLCWNCVNTECAVMWKILQTQAI